MRTTRATSPRAARRTATARRSTLLAAVLAGLVAGSASVPLAAQEPGYGFYRTVEGSVRLTTLERAEPLDVEPNYPLLVGDRIWVETGSRLEAVLPDRTIVRVGGATDIYFEELALFADDSPVDAGEGGEVTLLRLLEGEIQLSIGGDTHAAFGAIGTRPPRIDTPNARIHLQAAGEYRIWADTRGWSEVVVRDGFAEVETPAGSMVVRSGEQVVIDGTTDPNVRLAAAGPRDELEIWAERLTTEALASAEEPYVDESLAYAAAPLDQHGEWIGVDGAHAWRPWVAVDWRPYTLGYWTESPGGIFWVSNEPWGWATYHYGSWDYHPLYGWIWHPGRVFAPAWVYWYWGPTHVGWVPSGYYTRYYGPRYSFHAGFRFGTYGWIGGSWGHYTHWTFCPTRYFGWRSYRTHWRSGAELGRTRYAVPRGVLTTDTRGLGRPYWGRPDDAMKKLIARFEPPDRTAVRPRELPDVTDFVARKPRLSDHVRSVLEATPQSPRGRLTTGRPGKDPSAYPADRAAAVRPSAAPHATPDTTRVSEPRLPPRAAPSDRSRWTSPPQARYPARPDTDRTTAPPDRGRLPAAPAIGSRSVPRDMPPAREGDRLPGYGGQVRPPASALPPSPRSPGAITRPEPGPAASGRVPVVRRILDGIRGVRPSGPSSVTPPARPGSAPGVRPPTAAPGSTTVRPPGVGTTPQVSRPPAAAAPKGTIRPPASPPPASSAKPPPGRGAPSAVPPRSTAPSRPSARPSARPSSGSKAQPTARPPARSSGRSSASEPPSSRSGRSKGEGGSQRGKGRDGRN